MDNQQYLYVTTTGHITGNSHEIEIWYVTHGDFYYIVSEKWEKSHWVKNIRANPQVSVRVGDHTFDGVATIPDDKDLITAVKAKMDAKYKWSDGLVVQIDDGTNMEDEIVESTFETWVKYHFEDLVADHVSMMSGEYDRKELAWHDFDENPAILIEYISRLFASPVQPLEPYSDATIGHGLNLIITEIEGDLYELFNEAIPLDLRIQVVKNMIVVFEQIFAPRCFPVGLPSNNTAETKDTDPAYPLNWVCFMWWDIIMLYGKSGDPVREVFDPYCIDVMEQTLKLDSIACQHAALHGLGHWKSKYPERIVKIIDDFLERETDLHPELEDYAYAARTGMVL